jgi:hypothetical protein
MLKNLADEFFETDGEELELFGSTFGKHGGVFGVWMHIVSSK